MWICLTLRSLLLICLLTIGNTGCGCLLLVVNLEIQAYFSDTEGLVPDHPSKANTTIKQVRLIFLFPVNIKVMLIL